MAIVEAPVRNVPSPSRAIERRSELRPYLARMPVTQLMKNAAVLVKDPVVGVNQAEELVAAEEFFAHLTADLRIILGNPRRTIGVVVHQNRIVIRDHARQHLQLNRQLALGSVRLENGTRPVSGGL